MSRRYPLEPFLDATGWTMEQVRVVAPCNGEEYRRRLTEGVTEAIADRLATKAGLHPEQVWGRAFALPLCAECNQPFPASRRGQIYCTKRCRQRRLQREWKRRRYQTDEAFAEATRAARRAFYAECADYEKARERRRYHERKREDVAAA